MKLVRYGVVILAGAVAVSVAGCGTRSDAADVNGASISRSTLSDSVTDGLSYPVVAQGQGADKAAYTRSTLDLLISNEYSKQLAKKYGIDASDAAIKKLVADQAANANKSTTDYYSAIAAQNGLSPSQIDMSMRTYTVTVGIGKKMLADAAAQESFYDKHPEAFTTYSVAAIVVPTKDEADQIATELKANPGRFAELASSRSTDQSKSQGGEFGSGTALQLMGTFGDQIMSRMQTATPDQFIVTKFVKGGYSVVKIESRTVTKKSEIASAIKADQDTFEQTAGQLVVLNYELEHPASVSKQYGSWSATGGLVANNYSFLDSQSGTSAPAAAAPTD